jgi:hypothetical protein
MLRWPGSDQSATAVAALGNFGLGKKRTLEQYGSLAIHQSGALCHHSAFTSVPLHRIESITSILLTPFVRPSAPNTPTPAHAHAHHAYASAWHTHPLHHPSFRYIAFSGVDTINQKMDSQCVVSYVPWDWGDDVEAGQAARAKRGVAQAIEVHVEDPSEEDQRKVCTPDFARSRNCRRASRSVATERAHSCLRIRCRWTHRTISERRSSTVELRDLRSTKETNQVDSNLSMLACPVSTQMVSEASLFPQCPWNAESLCTHNRGYFIALRSRQRRTVRPGGATVGQRE